MIMSIFFSIHNYFFFSIDKQIPNQAKKCVELTNEPNYFLK